MKAIRLYVIGATLVGLSGCATGPKKPATETAQSEPLPVVDPFAPMTSETEEYWKNRNADDRAADEWDRAQQRMRGTGSP